MMQKTPIQCHLICSSASRHIVQIYAGFNLLASSGKIKMTVSRDKVFTPGSNHARYLKVIINGSIRAAYDTDDSGEVNDGLMEWSDLYFKRSYLASAAVQQPKLQPLGFNHSVFSSPDAISPKTCFWNLQTGLSKETVQTCLRQNLITSGLLGMQNGKFTSRVSIYEGLPSLTTPLQILFITRLWDAAPELDEKDRLQVNAMRAATLKALKKNFGSQLIAGLYPTREALLHHNGNVLSSKEIYKYRYLQKLKHSQICIATRGLCGSNGWRLAEYVAGAKAIVSETLVYGVPGEFTPGKNYLPFESPEECVKNVQTLLDDPEYRLAMMRSNHAYYHAYQRADILVWNSIQQALLGHSDPKREQYEGDFRN